MIPTAIPNDDYPRGAEQRPAAADESRLMAQLSIMRGGRHYFHDRYQYDRLSDAVAYAQLVRRQAHRPGPSSPAQFESLDSPTASDLQLMRELSISFENEGGCFMFEGFRYDRPIDAANYARHRRSGVATR